MNKSKKVALIFLLVLVVVTLFNNTFLYLSTPQVHVTMPKQGSIPFQFSVHNLEVMSEQMVQYISPDILAPFLAQATLKNPNQMAYKKGEVMIAFNENTIQNSFIQVEKENINQMLALRQFDASYIEMSKYALQNLEKAQKAQKSVQRSSEERKKQAQKAVEDAQFEYDLIVTQGVMNGEKRAYLEFEFEKSSTMLQALTEIKNNNFALTAPSDGLLIQKELLDGKFTYTFLPNDAPYLLQLKVDEQTAKCFDTNCVAYINKKTKKTDSQALQLKEIKKNEDASSYIIFDPQFAERAFLETPASFVVDMDSKTFFTLVPSTCFVEENVVITCLLNNEQTWGTVHYVKCETLPVQSKYIPVFKGVTVSNYLISGWDREIKEGEKVHIEQ